MLQPTPIEAYVAQREYFAEGGEALTPCVHRHIITVVVGIGCLSQIGERP